MKGKSSARGILAGYANPSLISQEKSAFIEAMAEKHSDKPNGRQVATQTFTDGRNNETN